MQLGTHTEYVLSLGEDYDRRLVVGHTIQYSIRFCFAPTGFALTEFGKQAGFYHDRSNQFQNRHLNGKKEITSN